MLGWGAYRGVLAIRDARLLIAASAASQLGDWLYNAALLAYVYIDTGSAAWVGAATIFRLLPYALLGPLGGVVADRYERRKVLLVGDLLRVLLMVALAAAVAAQSPIVVVIALTALSSVAGAAERPAAMALMPRLVGEARLGPANALLHTVQELGVVVGPAIGAILLTVAATWVAFAVNALTFVVSALLVARLRRRPAAAATAETERAASQLKQGLSTVWRTAYVVPVFLIVAMVELTYGAQTVQLVLYAEQQLGLGAEGYGYLLAAAGVGGLLSIVVNARLSTSSAVSRIVVGTGCGVLCDAAGVRAVRPRRRRPAGHDPRRHRTGRVRGRRRDDPRARGPGGRARPRHGVLRLADGRGDGRRSRARPRADQSLVTLDEPPRAGRRCRDRHPGVPAGLRGLDAISRRSGGGAGVARRHHRQGAARPGRPADRARGARRRRPAVPLAAGCRRRGAGRACARVLRRGRRRGGRPPR